jgi:ketosteroid isomerase-like protein
VLEPRDEREVVRLLWERFEARDWDSAGELLHEDVVVDWPHTRERIRGRRNVISLNGNYPEGWTIRVLRLVQEGDVVVSEIAVDQEGEGRYLAASVFEIREGLIERVTEYWVDPPIGDPPAWRAQWVERYEPE